MAKGDASFHSPKNLGERIATYWFDTFRKPKHRGENFVWPDTLREMVAEEAMSYGPRGRLAGPAKKATTYRKKTLAAAKFKLEELIKGA